VETVMMTATTMHGHDHASNCLPKQFGKWVNAQADGRRRSTVSERGAGVPGHDEHTFIVIYGSGHLDVKRYPE